MLTGSYRQEDVLELWDLRKYEKTRVINWDGPKASENYTAGMELEKEGEENKENDSPRRSPGRTSALEGSPGKDEVPTEIAGFSRQSPAPFIYSA